AVPPDRTAVMVVSVWLLETTVIPGSAMTWWLTIVGAGASNAPSHADQSTVYGNTASGSCTNLNTPRLPSDGRDTGLNRHYPHHPRHQLRQLPSVRRPQHDCEHQRRGGGGVQLLSVHRPQPDREHQRRRGGAQSRVGGR